MIVYFITQLKCRKMCSYMVEIESAVEAKTFIDKGKSIVSESVLRI